MKSIFYFRGNPIHTVRIEGEIMFSFEDVCRALEIVYPKNVKKKLIYEFGLEKLPTVVLMDKWGRHTRNSFITEPQMYFVMVRSKTSISQEFRRWVYAKVSPAIRGQIE